MSLRIFLGGILLLGIAACGSKPKDELPPEKANVRDIIGSHAGDISDCYNAALKRNPRFSGKLVLEWDVNPIGDPKNIAVIQSAERRLDRCMISKVSAWAFPPPQDNQTMKVRYPFVFSPPATVTEAEPVAAPLPPPVGKSCPTVEAEYAQLCVRDEKTGECILDDRQMSQVLRVLQDSPRLSLAYLADLDRMLKKPKPTDAEAKAIIAKLGEDCWTSIHVRIWNSIFHTFKSTSGHPRLAEAKDVMRQRVTEMDVPSPTLVALQMDLTILERAEDMGFIKPTGQAKKDLVFIRALGKKLVKEFAKEGGDRANMDSAKLVTLVRKELKSVRSIRIQLKDWSRKFWKKI